MAKGRAHTWTQIDADGEVHRYELHLHPASAGQKILWLLLGAAAEPLGRLIGSVLKAEDALGKIMGAVKSGQTDALGVFGDLNIDLAALGADLHRVVESLPTDQFAQDLLRFTLRDGHDLGNEAVFDAAYAGNYGELMQAMWKAIQANRFFGPLATLASGGAGLLAGGGQDGTKSAPSA